MEEPVDEEHFRDTMASVEKAAGDEMRYLNVADQKEGLRRLWAREPREALSHVLSSEVEGQLVEASKKPLEWKLTYEFELPEGKINYSVKYSNREITHDFDLGNLEDPYRELYRKELREGLGISTVDQVNFLDQWEP